MENANQSPAVGKRKPPVEHRFKPGNPGGPGRKRKTPEYKALEKMTKQQVQDALERMVGPALDRLLKIVAKGAEPEALKSAAMLIDRTIGAVPSSSYVATANVGQTQASITSAEDIKQLARAYVARLDQQPVEGSDG